jgi:hypothetical protein
MKHKTLHLTYIDLINYFRNYGNVVFECYGQKYTANTWNRLEQEYELNNGAKIKTLLANKNIMLRLKKSIENNEVTIYNHSK